LVAPCALWYNFVRVRKAMEAPTKLALIEWRADLSSGALLVGGGGLALA
jgi:hypothetical protein